MAEDVLFDIETLSLAGGEAPYVPEVAYTLRPRAGSATRSAAFRDGIGDHYQVIMDRIVRGRTMIGSAHRAEAVAVFESWAEMNVSFLKASAAAPGLRYQNYMYL